MLVVAKQALQFARHHARIATYGPAEFAVALFPEVLSALEFGQSRSKRRVGEDIGSLAVHSLASVAKLAVQDPKFRELAVARLSSADWDLLCRLHEINAKAFSQAYPELGMAGFAVRAALDDDPSWQRELLAWWGEMHSQVRDHMDPNALAFVGVVAEQRCPGTAWGLLCKLSLLSEERRTFSDIGLALVASSGDSVQRICGDILSERGADFGHEDEGIGAFFSRISSGAPSKGPGSYTTPVLSYGVSSIPSSDRLPLRLSATVHCRI